MNATFVDTGVWYAYANQTDRLHSRAAELLRKVDLPLVTIWPDIWEAINLASRQLGGRAAASLGKELISQGRARILELTTTDHVLALDLLARFDNLSLSAVDATACAIIRRLNILQVASFDEHFRILLPDRTVLGKA